MGLGCACVIRFRRVRASRLALGDDVHVDTDRIGLPDDPLHVRPTAGQLLPAAALAGSDHDLSDLMLAREPRDGPGGIVVDHLEPAGINVVR